VQGTTVVKTTDPSVICDSVDILHHTANHNCDDSVQLLLSPPYNQPTPNTMPELQQPPPLNLQQPPEPHEQPSSQSGQLNQIERFAEDLLPSSSEQQLMEISDTGGLPSMNTAATVPHQSGLRTVYHRQTQRGEEKEEGHLREEKSDDDKHDGVFLTEEEELTAASGFNLYSTIAIECREKYSEKC